MKQVEFEAKLRELRTQKGAAVNAIAQMQGEVKEEISAIDRQVKDLRSRREKLNQKRIILSQQRLQTEQYWGGQISKFFEENYEVTRELGEVSDWALANELKARGFVLNGTFTCKGKEEEFLHTFNAKLQENKE